MIRINKQFLLIITIIILNLIFLNAPVLNAEETQEFQKISGLDSTAQGGGYQINEDSAASYLLNIKIGTIIKIVLSLLGIIFFVIVWIGALDIAGANGNEEQVKKGKERITNGAIGILIILIAYVFTYLILQIVSRGPEGEVGPFKI